MERNFEYVGFWKRVLAALIDVIIFSPLMFLTVPLINFCLKQKTIIPVFLSSTAWTVFHMWLIVRFGGTPGKLIIKVRIVKNDGKYLNWGQAFLRILISGLIIFINSFLMQWSAIKNAPVGTQISSFMEMGRVMNEFGQPFATMSHYIATIGFIDALVIVFNKKKRAIHDFVAGSYVVTKKSLKNTTA